MLGRHRLSEVVPSVLRAVYANALANDAITPSEVFEVNKLLRKVFKQAVYDNIHRSQKAMEAYEEKLGLAHRYQEERQELAKIYESIEGLRQPGNEAAVTEVLDRLAPFLGRSQEVSL
ncbi:MAG: hypothetical protein II160_03690 [Selenomonas sp.]|nr:hypothetical protein [Selenomonas sp.]